MEFIKAHYMEVWAILATVLFMVSEMLGWSKKFESNGVFQFFWKIVKKGAGKEEEPKA